MFSNSGPKLSYAAFFADAGSIRGGCAKIGVSRTSIPPFSSCTWSGWPSRGRNGLPFTSIGIDCPALQ
eukprot:scaffold117147_cov66-Attheya_sp.AAC.2